MLPPSEWGTNMIARTDGQSRKQFYFFHDGKKVVKIVWTELQLTTAAPKGPSAGEIIETNKMKPVGPLIMMNRE